MLELHVSSGRFVNDPARSLQRSNNALDLRRGKRTGNEAFGGV